MAMAAHVFMLSSRCERSQSQDGCTAACADGFAKGCPDPPCYEERWSTARGIHQQMELQDGELGEAERLVSQLLLAVAMIWLAPLVCWIQ